MIIYGWNSKNIKQAPLNDYECPNCQQKQSVLAIFAKYVHIFWIPIFPYSKTAVIVCNHCKSQTEEKAIMLGTKESVKLLKAAVPIPKYLFSGLALIVFAIGYFTYQGIQDSKLEEAYINEPHIGDVYLIKNSEEPTQYNHYLMKVRKIEGDTLLVSYTSFNYNGIVTKLDPKDGFYNVMYAMHKNSIKELRKSGAIKDVIRDYSPTTGFDQEIEYQKPDSVGTH